MGRTDGLAGGDEAGVDDRLALKDVQGSSKNLAALESINKRLFVDDRSSSLRDAAESPSAMLELEGREEFERTVLTMMTLSFICVSSKKQTTEAEISARVVERETSRADLPLAPMRCRVSSVRGHVKETTSASLSSSGSST